MAVSSLLAQLVRRGFVDLAHLAWRPFADSPIQVEEYRDGDSYVVLAELPGLDPDRDIRVALVDDELRIRAERTASRHEGGRSDFRYGMFYRGVRLPSTVSTDVVDARYHRGILTVRVGSGVVRRWVGSPGELGPSVPVDQGHSPASIEPRDGDAEFSRSARADPTRNR